MEKVLGDAMKVALFTGAAITIIIATMAHGTRAGDSTSIGGVYTSVHYVEEAGDLLGMEVDFHPGPSPTIVLTNCEGACSGGKAWPVKIYGRRISFTAYNESMAEPSGKLSRTPVAYAGRFRADGTLELTVPGNMEIHEILHRVQHPRPNEVEQLGCHHDHC